jgi:hypothetical protein
LAVSPKASGLSPNAYPLAIRELCKTDARLISEKSPTMDDSTAERLHKPGAMSKCL